MSSIAALVVPGKRNQAVQSRIESRIERLQREGRIVVKRDAGMVEADHSMRLNLGTDNEPQWKRVKRMTPETQETYYRYIATKAEIELLESKKRKLFADLQRLYGRSSVLWYDEEYRNGDDKGVRLFVVEHAEIHRAAYSVKPSVYRQFNRTDVSDQLPKA